MVRAKFRVMDINRHFNGEITEVRLLPVGPKGTAYPDGCEENQSFWKWTPSGELNLRYGTVDVAKVPFKLGQAYYIDMEPTSQQTRWKLEVNSEYETQLDIKLNCKWKDEDEIRSGSLVMSIMNEKTWPAFLDAGPGSFWDVSFGPAPG